jgi:hypothetical protein
MPWVPGSGPDASWRSPVASKSASAAGGTKLRVHTPSAVASAEVCWISLQCCPHNRCRTLVPRSADRTLDQARCGLSDTSVPYSQCQRGQTATPPPHLGPVSNAILLPVVGLLIDPACDVDRNLSAELVLVTQAGDLQILSIATVHWQGIALSFRPTSPTCQPDISAVS